MKKAFRFLCVGLLYLSCNKVDTNTSKLNGYYMGYFHRNFSDTTQVSLHFKENTFQGESDSVYYPAVCKGSFEQKENTVTFYDSCHWASNFDGSLILNGTFTVQQNNDGSLRIWRERNGITDEYLLGQVATQ